MSSVSFVGVLDELGCDGTPLWVSHSISASWVSGICCWNDMNSCMSLDSAPITRRFVSLIVLLRLLGSSSDHSCMGSVANGSWVMFVG